ncbi:MAG: sigma-54-dependent Fis family transcriptional regulator [Gemmatimonadetes bacterium]|nr:sigma-54-dependent Fis family transcriptional regulator [Gemmatimonadota bacterium]
MQQPVIVVVRLSASFGDLWRQLAEGLGAELQDVAPGDIGAIPRTAAVLLGAGGAEREALDWLEQHANPGDVPVLVVGADPGRRVAAQAVAHGANDYFALPEDVELLRNAVVAAVARHGETARRARADDVGEPARGDFAAIAGESPALKTVLQRAARFMRHAHGTGLIVGDTGTGKELLARAIHEGGPRGSAPFVPVNCSALPRELIESELFGHEKGAFTDAHAAKPGLFEVAEGGTLFLDEVATLPLDVQGKLLRVLEDHEIRRVGGTRTRRVDVRVIAATNEDLEAAAQRGTFRHDLYFRLGVVTFVLPPLRERGDDVTTIAERLLETLGAFHRLPVPRLHAEARRALLSYAWPGNVRELKNALERALLLSPPGQLTLAELVPTTAPGGDLRSPVAFPAPLSVVMRSAAQNMLTLCGGNVSEAARRLRVSRRRLRRLIQKPEAQVGLPGHGSN